MIVEVAVPDLRYVTDYALRTWVVLAYSTCVLSRESNIKGKQNPPGHAAHSPESWMCTSPEGWTKPMNIPGQIGMGSFSLLMWVKCKLAST